MSDTKEQIVTVYHRTKTLGLVSKIVSLGIRIGPGALYGPGFYTTYLFESQNRSNMINTYGSYVIKAQIDIRDFLVLDYKKFRFPHWTRQLISRGYNNFDAVLATFDPEFTSQIALRLKTKIGFNELKKQFKGMIYTGETDGCCIVIWKPKDKQVGLKFVEHAYIPKVVSSQSSVNWKSVKKVEVPKVDSIKTVEQWKIQLAKMKAVEFILLQKELHKKNDLKNQKIIVKVLLNDPKLTSNLLPITNAWVSTTKFRQIYSRVTSLTGNDYISKTLRLNMLSDYIKGLQAHVSMLEKYESKQIKDYEARIQKLERIGHRMYNVKKLKTILAKLKRNKITSANIKSELLKYINKYVKLFPKSNQPDVLKKVLSELDKKYSKLLKAK